MNKHFAKAGLLLFSIPILFSNCATIVSKSAYPVSIETRPEGARVSITDKKGKEIFKGQSPTAVRLKSGAGFFSRAEYQVRLSAPGYEEKIIPVTFKLNGWYFGNVVFGGVIGLLIVDPASGAMWKIDRYSDNINEILNKAATSQVEPTLKIMDIDSVPQDLKKNLVRIK